MIIIEFDIPVYFTQKFKTKSDKTWLVGLSWFRNSHFAVQNSVKTHYSNLIKEKLKDTELSEPLLSYQVTYTYYYKNLNSDMPNVTSLASKFVNDVFQEAGFVVNDNVQYLVSEHHYVGGRDSNNPRVHVVLEKFKGRL